MMTNFNEAPVKRVQQFRWTWKCALAFYAVISFGVAGVRLLGALLHHGRPAIIESTSICIFAAAASATIAVLVVHRRMRELNNPTDRVAAYKRLKRGSLSILFAFFLLLALAMSSGTTRGWVIMAPLYVIGALNIAMVLLPFVDVDADTKVTGDLAIINRKDVRTADLRNVAVGWPLALFLVAAASLSICVGPIIIVFSAVEAIPTSIFQGFTIGSAASILLIGVALGGGYLRASTNVRMDFEPVRTWFIRQMVVGGAFVLIGVSTAACLICMPSHAIAGIIQGAIGALACIAVVVRALLPYNLDGKQGPVFEKPAGL